MKLELDEFASRYGLSPREREVVSLLANKIIHFKDIAQTLKLSPSTVNNHFKSIFEKTGTNSKSELLAAFLRHVVGKLHHCKHLVRTPQVLVLDDEPEICEFLVEELTHRGVKAYSFCDPLEALKSIPSLKIDTVISDLKMPKMDGIEFLREIRKIYHYFPSVLFVTGHGGRSTVEHVMDLGAVAILEKPIDMNRLFSLLMEQFIEDTHERNRYLAANEKIPTLIDGKLQLNIGNIGFGGVFIPLEHSRNGLASDGLEVGRHVSFTFQLAGDESDIRVVGEVVWKRESAQDRLPPGVGIKFIQISDADRERVREYVRLNRILSFIPKGKGIPIAGPTP